MFEVICAIMFFMTLPVLVYLVADSINRNTKI